MRVAVSICVGRAHSVQDRSGKVGDPLFRLRARYAVEVGRMRSGVITLNWNSEALNKQQIYL